MANTAWPHCLAGALRHYIRPPRLCLSSSEPNTPFPHSTQHPSAHKPFITMARVSRSSVEDTWSNSSGDESAEEIAFHPDDLDESFRYTPGDAVWIRTAGGNWRGKGATRQKEGMFHPVIFSKNLSTVRSNQMTDI
ncbi:hypothetical protein BDV98DRAFT_158203 [Pterulicium gracile]|uniref:Uncharacterized protein n=1 Tax=Pterulicium gracile TaxID=1884261 RepID=A0A5C3R0J5_9AGAR|nr:hypothetical protein BDV98DRAFT_158203 [Pterula gracilis]